MSTIHCMFCGGLNCKYENYQNWTSDPLHPNAVTGIYSTWITPNILAMARPSTTQLKNHDIINSAQISSIFNLQEAGEHAHCGEGIGPSGFSYEPTEFMDMDVFYYNFGWKDMEVPQLPHVLNIVQVMANALIDNKKIAVHCHAGLGRTGLAICCYLVWQRMDALAAVELVRAKRPGSVQTKKQLQFVVDFQEYVKSLRIVYPQFDRMTTFSMVMGRQHLYYHGTEQRQYRNIPKIVHTVVSRLIKLGKPDAVFQYIKEFKGDRVPNHVSFCQQEVNDDVWYNILYEESIPVLVDVLLFWFKTLKAPLIDNSQYKLIQELFSTSDKNVLSKMEKNVLYTINCIMDLFRAGGTNQILDPLSKLAFLLTEKEESDSTINFLLKIMGMCALGEELTLEYCVDSATSDLFPEYISPDNTISREKLEYPSKRPSPGRAEKFLDKLLTNPVPPQRSTSLFKA